MPKWLLPLIKLSLVFGVLIPIALPIYGTLVPWPIAAEALRSESEEKPVLFGASYQSRSTSDGSYERRTQTYALFPRSLKTFETVSVVQENNVVKVERQALGFLTPVLTFVVSLLGLGGFGYWSWSKRRHIHK